VSGNIDEIPSNHVNCFPTGLVGVTVFSALLDECGRVDVESTALAGTARQSAVVVVTTTLARTTWRRPDLRDMCAER
jgi:hypothetical protein